MKYDLYLQQGVMEYNHSGVSAINMVSTCSHVVRGHKHALLSIGTQRCTRLEFHCKDVFFAYRISAEVF